MASVVTRVAFRDNDEALTIGKSADCTIPLEDRDTLIKWSVILIGQSLSLI